MIRRIAREQAVALGRLAFENRFIQCTFGVSSSTTITHTVRIEGGTQVIAMEDREVFTRSSRMDGHALYCINVTYTKISHSRFTWPILSSCSDDFY